MALRPMSKLNKYKITNGITIITGNITHIVKISTISFIFAFNSFLLPNSVISIGPGVSVKIKYRAVSDTKNSAANGHCGLRINIDSYNSLPPYMKVSLCNPYKIKNTSLPFRLQVTWFQIHWVCSSLHLPSKTYLRHNF